MKRHRWLRALLVASASLGFLAVAGAGAVYYYLFPGYCKRLERHARDPEIQRALETWVDRNWSGEHISPESISLFDGIVPGYRWLPASFDGSLLALGPDAHVRLLGVDPRDVLDDSISPSVQAILFTDRSRAGVSVQLDDRAPFAWPSAQETTRLSGKVSVFCLW